MTLLLERVTFTYRRRRRPVLSRFTYEVPDHGLTILLGPNGAGKSTTLALLAGIVAPTVGRVLFSDTNLTSASREYRRHVAWLPQRVPTSPQLTAREYVAYIAWLKGESRSHAWDRAGVALERVGLAEQSGQKTAGLSGGQLRRVGIACALAHDARVILLDEPTAGLDPHQRSVFRDVLGKIARSTPVLMSTHDVIDLADAATTVTLMESGRVLHHGDTQSFLDHARSDAAPGRRAESAYSALMRLDSSR
ncbi:ATP-binding cassette domain-containing protein [Streptomyces sp. NBC_01317]|uniref:ATP-binding cassette domain-containing protein n=1 Tax=Streptomyces sp. NBC_01317 TaxID=2903822 RepID=UPI002E129E77|nr:ATP-binding cassette domain-containing protein [Streptomyces sp. NBC_01317]